MNAATVIASASPVAPIAMIEEARPGATRRGERADHGADREAREQDAVLPDSESELDRGHGRREDGEVHHECADQERDDEADLQVGATAHVAQPIHDTALPGGEPGRGDQLGGVEQADRHDHRDERERVEVEHPARADHELRAPAAIEGPAVRARLKEAEFSDTAFEIRSDPTSSDTKPCFEGFSIAAMIPATPAPT